MKLPLSQKIAISFSLLAGFLVLASTFLTFFIIYTSLTEKSYQTLESSLSSFSTDLANNLLKEKEVNYQGRVRQNQSDYNISNKAYSENKVTSVGQIDREKLEASKEVYSRLIDANGNVIYTSDLFETYKIDPLALGRHEYNYGPVCMHTLTGKTQKDETVQVARYCPLSQQSATEMLLLIAGGSFAVLIVVYVFGLILAKILLKPLEAEVNLHKKFIQDARHELITPLTVAMSTADAALLSANFKQGLHDLKNELSHAYNTLNLLVSKYIHKKVESNKHVVNLNQLVAKVIADKEALIKQRKSKFAIHGEQVEVEANQDIVQSILRNLLENSMIHSPEGDTIKINFTQKQLEISNNLGTNLTIDPNQLIRRGVKGSSSNGKGIGLTLTKELVELIGWRMSLDIKDESYVVRLDW